jgi:hypothetical protein
MIDRCVVWYRKHLQHHDGTTSTQLPVGGDQYLPEKEGGHAIATTRPANGRGGGIPSQNGRREQNGSAVTQRTCKLEHRRRCAPHSFHLTRWHRLAPLETTAINK